MLWEGKEACLLFPMSLELSVEEAAMILWCQNYGRAQREEDSRLGEEDSRCCDECSAQSEKSSAVNKLEDLLDLELLWSSIQGHRLFQPKLPSFLFGFHNTKYDEKYVARNKRMLTLCLARAENESMSGRAVQSYCTKVLFTKTRTRIFL